MTTLLSDIKWGNKTQIVDFIKEQSKARRDELHEFHQEMYLNILWVVMGIQDIYYDRYSKKLNDTPPEPWKVRLISNLLYPLLRRSVAKMAKKPIWDVLPATTEQADLDAARISSLILRFYWYFLRMPKKYLQYLTWLFATGNAFFKMGWDPELGDTITFSDEDRAALTNAYPGKRIPKSFQLGDPYIEVVSPFSIFWEAGIDLEESDWVIQLKLRSPDYVYNRWNVKVEGSTTKGESDLFDLKLINVMEHTYPESDKVITYEFFTNEKHAVVVDDKVVYLGPNVLGSLPYVHTVEQIVPGSEHGMSTLRQARSNQAQYNKVRSGIIEHANLMCAQKWLVPRGANILRQAINNKPGEVILYNYPFAPTATVPPPLPNYYERILEVCKQDISDISSVQAVSQAKNEPGIRSGRMILALQEADDLLMGPVMQLIDDSLIQLGTKFLKVIADNVEEERLIKITGEGNELEVLTFKGKDIYGPNKGRSGANYFDVRIQTYTSYPLSRIGMEQRIDGLLERGVLHPQLHRDKILQMLGSGDITSIFDETQVDRSIATKENYQMLRGEPVEPSPIENHVIHLEVLDRFWKTRIKEFEGKALVMKHRETHEKLMAFEAVRKQAFVQQAAASMGMMPPEPEGKGS